MRLVTHPTSQESELVQEVKTNNFTDDQPHLHKDVLCLIKKFVLVIRILENIGTYQFFSL